MIWKQCWGSWYFNAHPASNLPHRKIPWHLHVSWAFAVQRQTLQNVLLIFMLCQFLKLCHSLKFGWKTFRFVIAPFWLCNMLHTATIQKDTGKENYTIRHRGLEMFEDGRQEHYQIFSFVNLISSKFNGMMFGVYFDYVDSPSVSYFMHSVAQKFPSWDNLASIPLISQDYTLSGPNTAK